MISFIQDSYWKKTQDWLLYNSSTVLVVPAVLFNILSLIVLNRFQKPKSGHTSTTFYMKCICIFDTLTIVAKFLNEIIVVRNGQRANPFIITSFMCKFISFCESTCAISSIYLLIAMSIDKLICVLSPLKVSQILTPAKARITFAIVLILSMFISSYNLFDKRVYELELNTELEAENAPRPVSTTTSTTTTSTTSYLVLNYTNLYNSTSSKRLISIDESNSNRNKTIKINYDCDSNWPHRKNDWILFNNIIRVFLPILSLCICNSWIVCALAKAKKNTDALFGNNKPSASPEHKGKDLLRKHIKANNKSEETNVKLKNLRRLSNKNINNNNNNNNNNNSSDSENEFQDDYDEEEVDEFKINSKANAKNINKNNLYVSNRLSNSTSFQTSSSQLNSKIFIKGGRSNTHHISIMLFAVSFGFVLLNLPFAIRTIFHRQFSEQFKILDYLYQTDNLFALTTSKTEINNAVIYEFFSSLTHLLLDLNYIGNFFLYFFSGTRFRAQLVSLLKCEPSQEQNKKYTSMSQINHNNVNNSAYEPKKFKNPFMFLRYHLFKKNTSDQLDGLYNLGDRGHRNILMFNNKLNNSKLNVKI